MADERHVSFGLSGLGSVWSVDDAWFEGSHTSELPALPIVEEIHFDECDNDYRKLLEAIASRESQVEDMGPIALKIELEYLKVLAKLCWENNLCLTLCNFEHFEKEQHIINREKTAVLLDIRYDDFQRTDKESPVPDEQYEPENYGYLLLADLLKGKRPRADIFFVTSRAELARKVRLMHKTAPGWWPLRTIPYISKFSDLLTDDTDTLEDELKAFITYFKQGIDNDPLKEFSNALLKAQSFPHPERDFATVPDDFPLKSLFMSDAGQEYENESFKALYMPNLGGRGDRDLLTRIFISHLRHAGVRAEAKVDGTFKLPVAPGMLFVLCLLDLHNTLEFDDETTTLNLKAGDLRGVAEIFIPLRTPNEFKAAFFTRETNEGSVNALRRLLGCKETVFRKHVNADSETVDPLIDRWKANRMTSSGKHYNILAKPIFDDSGLTVTWEYALSPADPDI